MIDISDEKRQQRSLAKIGTLKRSVRKYMKAHEGGAIPVSPEEASDAMFMDFVHMVAKLKLEFDPYSWIIFRFVFMQIPLDMYTQIYNDYNATTMPSVSQNTMTSRVLYPSKEKQATVPRDVFFSKSRRSHTTPRMLTSMTPRVPTNRMIGKGTE